MMIETLGKVILCLLILIFFPIFFLFDMELLEFLQEASDSKTVDKFARFLSSYGRLEWSTILPACILFFISFFSAQKKRWKRLATACFLGGLLAGISVWPPKTLLGRERPYGAGEGEMHFMKFNSITQSVYHSMPSGHAASTMGSAWVVLQLHPAAGIPLLLGSLATGWSRVKMNKHWPSDVIGGWILGVASAFVVSRRYSQTK